MVDGRQSLEGKPQAVMAISEKSDEVVVAEKSAKSWVTPGEPTEGRTEAEGKVPARPCTKRVPGTGRERRAHVPVYWFSVNVTPHEAALCTIVQA